MIVTNPKSINDRHAFFVTIATISTSIDNSTDIPKAITTLPIKIDKYRAIAMTITTTITTLTMKVDNYHAIPTTIPTLQINIYKYYAIPDLTTPGRPIPAQGEMAICSGKRVITYFYNS